MEAQNSNLEAVISQWIESQPAWYSAALHIALKSEFTTSDVDALTIAACQESNVEIESESDKTLAGYQDGDLANAGISDREVVLESIQAINGINAIVPGSVLVLATNGITVIYGNNGSGKSGFSRIIRNACTSRSGPVDILSNVFEDNGVPEVSFNVRINNKAEASSWRENSTEYPAFPEIAFFDSACALQEVGGKDNAVLYVPRIIEALNRFSRLVADVSERIQLSANQLGEELDLLSVPTDIRNMDQVFKILSCNVSANAKKLISEAVLNQQDTDRLLALPQLIAADPSADIPKVDRRLKQLNGMRERLGALYLCCQTRFVQSLKDATYDEHEAEKATAVARQLVSGSSRLEGIGSDVWKALWEAAREYSNTVAYPSSKYPLTTHGAACPLCQQPLSDEAATRMSTFESYIKGAAEKSLAEKQEAVSVLEEQFVKAVVAVRGDKAGIGILETEQARNQLDELTRHLEPITNVPEESTLTELSGLTQAAGTYVRAEIEELKKKLQALQENIQPGRINQMKAELVVLKGRSWIANNKELLVSNAAKRETKANLEIVRKKCNTRPITNLVSTVSKMEIIERMQASFDNELRRLKATNQQVSITTRARSGQEYQRITLTGSDATTQSVLSEGEQKIVALAGFFALLDVIPRKSTVVLDDPITSLDHLWRSAVATRIVEEAKVRPVVVFTHDPMFCNALSELSAEANTPIEYRTVYRKNSSTGVVIDGLDWEACNVSQRIKELRNEAVTIRQRNKAGEFKTDSELNEELRHCYSKLRSTWERAVEFILLAGVVERAKRPIHTQKLKNLIDITEGDVRVVDENMSKCSRITEAHDDPLATPDALPTIQELEEDVTVLAEWTRSINLRR